MNLCTPSLTYITISTLTCFSHAHDSTYVVHEDQFIDEVGVEKPNCAVIFYEYVWKSKEEPVVKDELLPSAHHPRFPDMFCDSTISSFSSENSYPYVYTSDHQHNTQDVNPSFECGEDTTFFLNPPNLSSFLSRNSKGEKFYFSLTPLSNLSDHEDVDVHLEFFYHGFI